MKNRGIAFFCTAACLMCLFCVFAGAEEAMPDEYGGFLDTLPDGMGDSLPDGIFSDDAEKVSDAVIEMSGVEYLLSAFFSTLGSGIGEVLPHFLVLTSIVLISSVCNLLSSHLTPSGVRIFDTISHITLFGAIGTVSVGVVGEVKDFFSALSGMIGGFVPLSASLYTMGGNVGTALKSSTGLLATLGIVEFISGMVVVPLFCFCLCMSFISGLSPDIVGGNIGGGIKKAFLTALGIITAILALSLSTQTLIASKTDNLAMRGMKMFLGGVPISGGTVSASLGTIATGIEMIRGAVGVGGVILLLLALLPVIMKIWLMRALYGLLASFSGMVGLPLGQKLFSEAAEAYGILEGVCIMCSLVFIIAMAVMSMSMPAIA